MPSWRAGAVVLALDGAVLFYNELLQFEVLLDLREPCESIAISDDLLLVSGDAGVLLVDLGMRCVVAALSQKPSRACAWGFGQTPLWEESLGLHSRL